MRKFALIFVAIIAILHFYIAWFEMFAWTTRGPNVFDTFPPELFEQTIQLAANQGIYNAFLAIGLVWSILIKEPKWQTNVAFCFLGFVLIAGVTAAVTVAVKTGLVQIVPSSIALILIYVSRESKKPDTDLV